MGGSSENKMDWGREKVEVFSDGDGGRWSTNHQWW